MESVTQISPQTILFSTVWSNVAGWGEKHCPMLHARNHGGFGALRVSKIRGPLYLLESLSSGVQQWRGWGRIRNAAGLLQAQQLTSRRAAATEKKMTDFRQSLSGSVPENKWQQIPSLGIAKHKCQGPDTGRGQQNRDLSHQWDPFYTLG